MGRRSGLALNGLMERFPFTFIGFGLRILVFFGGGSNTCTLFNRGKKWFYRWWMMGKWLRTNKPSTSSGGFG